jgi:hypothetical protein
MHIADVVTEPAMTPVSIAARRIGCSVQSGRETAEEQRDLQLDFFGFKYRGVDG